MDITQPPYSQSRFDQISNQVTMIARSYGYSPNNVAVIPVSGLHGDAMMYLSDNMPWFKGWSRSDGISGLTFRDALDGYRIPNRAIDKSFRMPVQKVYKVFVLTISCYILFIAKLSSLLYNHFEVLI